NYKRIVDLPDDCEAIITVTRGEDVSKGGAVFVNEQMDLVDLREKPKPGEPTSPWYNAGLYAFRPSIFDFIAKLKRSRRGGEQSTKANPGPPPFSKKGQEPQIKDGKADVPDPPKLLTPQQNDF